MNQNNLTPKQQQQLRDIGLHLQKVRSQRRLSLADLSQQTLISQRLLAAIEAGDCTELPEPFYIRALIDKYAGAMETQVNADLLVQSNPQNTANQSASPSRRYWLNFQLRSLHLYLLYIVLVIASVSGITALVERPVIVNQPIRDRSPVLVPEGQSPDTTQVSQPQTTPQFISRANNSELVSVGIDLQERCWLKVMVDGKVAYEGILPQGTKRHWSGKREVTIRAGNAGGVVISFNNQQQQILGAPGQVEEITYTVN